MGSVQYQVEHLVHLQPKNLAAGMKSITQMFGTLTSMDVASLPQEVASEIAQKNGTTPDEHPVSNPVADGVDQIDSPPAPAPGQVEDGEVEKEKPGRAARLWSKAAGAAHPTKKLQRILSTPSPPPSTLPVPQGRRVSDGGKDEATTPGEKKMDMADIVRKVRLGAVLGDWVQVWPWPVQAGHLVSWGFGKA